MSEENNVAVEEEVVAADEGEEVSPAEEVESTEAETEAE